MEESIRLVNNAYDEKNTKVLKAGSADIDSQIGDMPMPMVPIGKLTPGF
jgi:hypothetical protein